jgi:hypothetical protein
MTRRAIAASMGIHKLPVSPWTPSLRSHQRIDCNRQEKRLRMGENDDGVVDHKEAERTGRLHLDLTPRWYRAPRQVGPALRPHRVLCGYPAGCVGSMAERSPRTGKAGRDEQEE